MRVVLLPVALVALGLSTLPAAGGRPFDSPFVLSLSKDERVAQGRPNGQVNPQAAAMQDFQQRLNQYLDLRTELAGKLEPLSPAASARELTARQQALVAALRAARQDARPGDLIPPAVAAQIRTTVAADLKRRKPTDTRAVLGEVPSGPPPVINSTYPAQAALSTVPPLLLSNLPQLPDNLQYRFYGRDIVLLDGDADIIVDYVTKALPPH